jgi:hypothetical protein
MIEKNLGRFNVIDGGIIPLFLCRRPFGKNKFFNGRLFDPPIGIGVNIDPVPERVTEQMLHQHIAMAAVNSFRAGVMTTVAFGAFQIGVGQVVIDLPGFAKQKIIGLTYPGLTTLPVISIIIKGAVYIAGTTFNAFFNHD